MECMEFIVAFEGLCEAEDGGYNILLYAGAILCGMTCMVGCVMAIGGGFFQPKKDGRQQIEQRMVGDCLFNNEYAENCTVFSLGVSSQSFPALFRRQSTTVPTY